MTQLQRSLGEAKNALLLLKVIDLFLDALIGFFIGALILLLLGFPIYAAILPAIFYVMLEFFYWSYHTRPIENIEKRYPTLNDRLRTIRDNRAIDNLVINRLRMEVGKELTGLNAAALIDKRTVGAKCLTLSILIFTTVVTFTVTASWFHQRQGPTDDGSVLAGMEETLENLKKQQQKLGASSEQTFERSNYSADQNEQDQVGAGQGGFTPGYSEGPIPGSGAGVGEEIDANIYGTASSASLAGEDIQFQITPEFGGDIDVDEPLQLPDTNYEFNLENPQAAQTCTSCIVAAQHQKLVSNYFQRLWEQTQ